MRKSVLLVLASIVFPSCATDEASKFREEKPFTVGLTGVQYRPNKNLGIGIGSSLGSTERKLCESFFCSSSDQEKGLEFTSGKKVEGKSTYWDFGGYANYFVWDTSAFFVGGGLTYRSTDVDATIKVTKENASYKSTSVFLRPSLGWNWIWTPGFSLFLDFGFGVRVTHSRTFDASSPSDDVKDAAKYIDDTVFRIGSTPVGGGSGLIGWSFAF